MSNFGKILVAGLGSPHGDDQAGWLVAEKVGEVFRSHPDVVVRRALIPLDVLDWLEDVDVLHICDACETTQRHDRFHRLTWNAGQFVDSKIQQAVGNGSFNRVPSGPREQCPVGWIPPRGALPTRLNECAILNPAPKKPLDFDVNSPLNLLRCRGSHDFGLPDVLQLAEKTGLLPKQVIIWAIEGNCFQPEDVLSDETRIAVRHVVNDLMTEIRLCHA